MAIVVKNTPKVKPPPTTKPHISRRLHRIAEKIANGGLLAKAELLEVEKIIEDSSHTGRAKFLNIMREYSGKTEEEILEQIKESLVKKEGRGKPSGAGEDETMVRIMLAYRLQQRGLTYVQIADNLKVSPQQVNSYLKTAREYLKVDPSKVDVPLVVGETLNFYEDVRGMALMLASVDKSSPKEKLHAMSVALQAERDKIDFLSRTGVLSPAVVQVFQQVILQQMNLNTQQTEKEVGGLSVSDIMAEVAKKLQASVASSGNIIEHG